MIIWVSNVFSIVYNFLLLNMLPFLKNVRQSLDCLIKIKIGYKEEFENYRVGKSCIL